MPKYKFDLAGMEFGSKTAVIKYVQTNIRSKYGDYQPLSENHLRFMTALLRYHPQGDQKIGMGICKMWVQPNENFPTKGFWLERIDGTKTDFSFYQCVSAPSPLRDFKEACRKSISKLVTDFRHHYFSGRQDAMCQVLGKPITIYTSHVDHAPPWTFEEIVSKFIETKNIDVEKAPLTGHADGKIGTRFADEVFEEEWVDFHNEKANLRVISAEANLKRIGQP